VSDQFQFGIANYRKDAYITAVESIQKADCFFIIRQGQVKVSGRLKDDGDEVLVPGDFFGVVSAMSSHSHIESAVALTDVTLITVRPQQYISLIQKNAQVAAKIIMQLSGRLRVLDEALTKVIQRDGEKPVKEGSFRLFDAAEYYFRRKLHGQAFHAYGNYLKYYPDGEKLAAATGRLKQLADLAGKAGAGHEKGDLNRAYREGDMLFVEGEPGNELFVIQSGSVRVARIVDDEEVLLGIFKAGDILGEMALLDDKPRAASAVVVEDCAVMAVNKANFELLIREQPQLVSKITTLLAGRIWFAHRQLENALVPNPLGRIYGILLIHLEKSWANLDSQSPHVFDLKWDDLVRMLGFAEKEGFILMGEMQEKDKNVQVKDGRIHAGSIKELARIAELYQKMDQAKARQE